MPMSISRQNCVPECRFLFGIIPRRRWLSDLDCSLSSGGGHWPMPDLRPHLSRHSISPGQPSGRNSWPTPHLHKSAPPRPAVLATRRRDYIRDEKPLTGNRTGPPCAQSALAGFPRPPGQNAAGRPSPMARHPLMFKDMRLSRGEERSDTDISPLCDPHERAERSRERAFLRLHPFVRRTLQRDGNYLRARICERLVNSLSAALTVRRCAISSAYRTWEHRLILTNGLSAPVSAGQ